MTGRELLRICRQEKKELLILAEKREQLATSLLPKAMSIKAVSVIESAETDPMAKRIAAAVDLDREIERQMERLHRHETEAHKLVQQISVPVQRQVLELYYLSFWVDKKGEKRLYDWEMIQKKLNYSERAIFYIHADAMKSLQ